MRQRCIANGSILAGQIVYASHRGGYYVTTTPIGNPNPIGVAMVNADQDGTVIVQLADGAQIVAEIVSPRCDVAGSAFVGGTKHIACDLPAGHAGNHQYGDFTWTDAGQAARDQQLATEAGATLDREFDMLDEILAGPKP